MHSNSYNIKVGCISGENFIKSLEEVKSFFSFKLVSIDEKSDNLIDDTYNALIVEGKLENKNLFGKTKIPKISNGMQNIKIVWNMSIYALYCLL